MKQNLSILFLRADGGQYKMKPIEAAAPNVHYLTKADLPWLRTLKKCSFGAAFYEGVAASGRVIMRMTANRDTCIEANSANLAGRLQTMTGGLVEGGGYWRNSNTHEIKGYDLWLGKRYNDTYVQNAIRALKEACDLVETLPAECTSELYDQYHRTGVYYADHVVSYGIPGKNHELRIAVPLSVEAATQWQRTYSEKAALETMEQTLRAAKEAAGSKQTIFKAMKESYEAEIHYSKIIRWGLTGVAGVAAVVLLVLIVMAFTAKKKK